MQNIGSSNEKTQIIKKDNENFLEVESFSSDFSLKKRHQIDEATHSDSNSKNLSIEKRSRFARAFRSFSRSSIKKDKLRPDLEKVKSSGESFYSSEGEELYGTNSEKKKKAKFFLGGLKKSKIAPSISHESYSNINKAASAEFSEELVEKGTTKDDNETHTHSNFAKIEPDILMQHDVCESSSILGDSHKQITDESKIILTKNSIGYVANDDKPINSKEKKKVKTQKITSIVSLTHIKKEKKSSVNKLTSNSSFSEQQITITKNTQDSPPIERAPTKPKTNVNDNRSSPSGTCLSNKPKLRTVIQSSSINQPRSSTIKQRIETSIKKLPPIESHNLSEAVTRSAEIDKTKKILMQNPTNSSQRGHRFPKPSKVLATVGRQNQSESVKSTQNLGKQKEKKLSSSPVLSETLKNNIHNQNIAEKGGIFNETISPADVETNETQISLPSSKTGLLESSENSAESNSDSQSSHKDTTRRRIRYIAPSIFDVYDSLTASSAIAQTESVNPEEKQSVKSEKRTESKKIEMSSQLDLSKEATIQPAIMASNNCNNVDKREHLYKILVIGELGTGKTSFIKRYVHQFFSQNYRATIGVDFALKVLQWDANTIVRLQLWDIAGQERFGNMTRVYYKEAVGAFIVFDVTRSGTFECVSKWKDDLDSKVQLPDGSPIPCILLANKCDQEKQGTAASQDKMDEYVRDAGFAGWFETSAKENINIDEAARALVNKILLNDKLISSSDLTDCEKFNLNNSSDGNPSGRNNKCSC